MRILILITFFSIMFFILLISIGTVLNNTKIIRKRKGKSCLKCAYFSKEYPSFGGIAIPIEEYNMSIQEFIDKKIIKKKSVYGCKVYINGSFDDNPKDYLRYLKCDSFLERM